MRIFLKNLFTLKNIKGDIFGGLTAGIVALPLAMAFGEQSGLGAAAGLYGAIAIGFFASLICSTQTQISGPTAPMTAVSMIVIAKIIQANDGSVSAALPSILMVFFLAGILQIILGIIGIGKYIKFIPYPVISGFMTGIGIIIIMGQIFPLLGYNAANDIEIIQENRHIAEANLIAKILESGSNSDEAITLKDLSGVESKVQIAKRITEDQIIEESINISKSQVKSPIGILKNIHRGFLNFNYIEFIFVIFTLIVIYGFQRLIKKIPSKNVFINRMKTITSSIPTTLIALILVSLVAILFGINLYTIDKIPQGFPPLHFDLFTQFHFRDISPFVMAIVSLALLGSIDSLLTSVIVDNMTKTRHNSSQELISQGVGNSMSALLGGIPGASATIRTLVNINSGGKTRISGIVAALLLLSILLALAPIASLIPSAVLSGVLITVGIGIMDYKGLKAIGKMPIGDVVVMFVVMLLTIFFDLVIAVGVGLMISALIFMKQMGEISVKQSGLGESGKYSELPWDDEKHFPEELRNNIFIKHLEGPIFFGSTNDLQLLSAQIPKRIDYVVVRMDRVPYIDQSGLYALEDIFIEIEKKDIEILIVGIQKQPEYLMRKIELLPKLVDEAHSFKSFKDCLEWIKENVLEKRENHNFDVKTIKLKR